MTDRRSVLDTALDVLVYAPIGAAVTVGEWLPRLSEKGRARFGEQAQVAGVVGRLAVGEGRRRAAQATERLLESRVATPKGRPAVTARRSEPAPDTASEQAPAGASEPAPGAAGEPATGAGVRRRAEPRRAVQGRVRPAGPPPSSLAIPDYDSLSASQVTARLAGLSAAELEEVRLHETATRARRSVLARIDQLRRGG